MRRSADDLLRRQRRRALPAAVARCAALLTLAAVLPAPAHAEEVFTGQAAAANATDSTWIDPPAQRAAVCIVDSGNDPNPDTTNVIARLAVDGGDGGDVDPNKHGTLMSMIASAPYNGWGMVGAAPSVNVVSVRAMRSGTSNTFGLSDILVGVRTCQNARLRYGIKVISLSLGAQHVGELDAASETAIRDRVDTARRSGLNVVAAAGNRPGAVDWPAAYSGAFAVGASARDGSRCAFAASGPEVDLWTSGCPQDVSLADGRAAWASGSSEAAALTAGILAQLRGLRPDMTVEDAESLLVAHARSQTSGRVLDVAAAFLGVGLGAQLAQGHSVIPSSPISVAPSVGAAPSEHDLAEDVQSGTDSVPVGVRQPHSWAEPAHRVRKPRLRAARYGRGQLMLVFQNKPPGARARVQIYARGRSERLPTLARTVLTSRDRVRTRVSGTINQVSITYVDPMGRRPPSVPLTLRP